MDTAVKTTFRAQEILPALEAAWSNDDSGAPTAEIVIVRPGESSNNRFYSKEAIQRAVEAGFWNGSKMFLDHGDAKMPMKRSITALVSGITETHLGTEGEARGYVRFFNRDFAKFAQEAKDHIGVSIVHEFRGRRFRGTDGKVHEQVDDFVKNHSVDWVAFPAAGGGITQFLPAQESEADVDWDKVTPELLREHAAAVVEQIETAAREAVEASEGGQPPTLPTPKPTEPTPPTPSGLTVEDVRAIAQEAAENARREFEEERAKEADVRQKVGTLVGKSGLPDKTRARIAASFDGSTEFVEATVQEAIEDAKAEIAEIKGAGPRVYGLGASGNVGTITSGPTLKDSAAFHAFESAMGVELIEKSAGSDA